MAPLDPTGQPKCFPAHAIWQEVQKEPCLAKRHQCNLIKPPEKKREGNFLQVTRLLGEMPTKCNIYFLMPIQANWLL